MKWKKPVLVGDVLTGTTTVLATRRSRSRPAVGIVQFRTELFNQRGETVLETENPSMVRLREPEAAA